MTFLLMGLATALLAALGGCAATVPPERFEYTRLCMGVRTRIVLHASNEPAAAEAAAAAFGRIAELDACMSDYRADSELSQLNARAGQGPVPVSGDLFAILQLSNRISSASDGGFDITVAPLVALWRAARRDGALPDAHTLAAAREKVGWRFIVLDEQRQTAQLSMPGMKLDLGGIGKGWAAQEAVDLLRARGMSRCLVALAGDIAAGDPPPGERGWRIAVTPYPDAAGRNELLLANAAISTSGDTEQFIEIGGVRYSHIVDPRTGLGVTGGIAASVIAPRGGLADGLASALCVAGVDRVAAIIRAFPGTAAIVEPSAADRGPPLIVDPDHRIKWWVPGGSP